ncbi:hypothetical protein Sjap_020144 [Stephania japonica]|uniref:Uncharacterized protein n=1 Tax=Stephania japonica TaxID=461633 RepID=A0AAP0F2U8_9MAGN
MASTSSIDHHQDYAADNLAASLVKKLEVEYPLISPNRCIFKVPHKLRVVNEKVFVPKAVSIGPYHHKKLEQYEAMEKYKLHYLKQFLHHNPCIPLKTCVKNCVLMLKRYEKSARECYAEDISKLSSDEFVEMMMLDGCFIVELFLMFWIPPKFSTHFDPLFAHKYSLNRQLIAEDLVLLENQLPFFVLQALFDFINNASQSQNHSGISFLKLALRFFNCNEEGTSTLEEPSHLLDLIYKTSIPSKSPKEGDEMEERDGGCLHLLKKKKKMEMEMEMEMEPSHLLDLKYIMSIPSKKTNDNGDGGGSPRTLPTATQLWEAGVKFRAAPRGTHLLYIKFENGTLEIPTIIVEDDTEQQFRNMIAYEQCSGERSHMTDYFIVIDDLVSSPGDVSLLKRKGIFINWLGDDEEASNMVNKMGKNVYVSSEEFQYKDLYKKLNDYYANPWRKWKAMLKHDYFNTPWSLVAFLAALAVLICTFIQTVNS